MRDVVHKADGVFLWARVALNLLFKGVMARDPPKMLRKRLGRLNSSLDGVFQDLLDDLDDDHKSSAANYLLFERTWYQRFGGSTDLSVLDLAVGCRPDLKSKIQNLKSSEEQGATLQSAVKTCVQEIDDFAASLEAQCAGLLDMNISSSKCNCRNVMPEIMRIRDLETPRADNGLWTSAEFLYNLQIRAHMTPFVL